MNAPDSKPLRGRTWLSRNVIVLGMVSLLTDAASEMVIPLLPIFLTTMGAGALVLGWIEGLAEATASLLKLLSGRWADRLGRNRPFILAGYSISSVARPLFALATSPWHVLAVRLTDRTGKGLRTSPRDALIAASVRPEEHGAAFGFHRAMDHVGAVIGPLMAFAFLTFWSQDLHTLFWLTAVPGTAAVLVLYFGVREVDRPVVQRTAATTEPKRSGQQFVAFLVPLGLFTLGNASDVFLLLKANATEAPLQTLPLLWMGLHVVKTIASLLGGHLADRWGRRKTIALGWVVYAAIYAGFAFADSIAQVWGLFVVYGIYHGLTEGPEKALVADLAPDRSHGRAFGWYHFTLGMLTLLASVLFGWLWDAFGSRTAFLTSGSLALLGVLALGVLAPRRLTP